MRILFVKDSLAWPRSSGHDVHSYHMMRALGECGHKVSLVTFAKPAPAAIEGLPLHSTITLDDTPSGKSIVDWPSTRLQERFRSYWGVGRRRIAAVRRVANDARADAVVVVGLGVLPYFMGLQGRVRVWYAADEWVLHHWSQWRVFQPRSWSNLRQMLIKGLYERAFRRVIDRVWVVSEGDQRAMRAITGIRNVDLIANGIDADYYRPSAQSTLPFSCVFWGRLDFGPNVQALQWFVGNVWPKLRTQTPEANLAVFGFNPTDAVRELTRVDGIRLIPDLPDLRDAVTQYEVAVFPFVSGGGIKNKLLEAAAMAMPIVCTPRTLSGIRTIEKVPIKVAGSAGEWVHAIRGLWANAEKRRALGDAARAWVMEEHSWNAAAEIASRGLAESLAAQAIGNPL